MRVLVLGAGFGGLEIASRLSESLGDEVEVVLVDKNDSFVFGFSKLDVMFGRTESDAVHHHYRDVLKPGVRFVQAEITEIDPVNRAVTTSAGRFDADVMVVALGADYEPEATPGLLEAGHEFYSVAGAFATRRVLQDFAGGNVIVGVTSSPFKCPPAPSETALMMHDLLVARGLREQSTISLVMPLPAPVPPSPAASHALLAAFAERGITFIPETIITSLDGERSVAVLAGGGEIPFDLFLGVPKHKVPSVVAESGMCVDGWIPVDPLTLETSFDGVYAVGDVTSVGTPKAGVFSERQAGVVAERILERHRSQAATTTYDGVGLCYLEFGHDEVARVNVTFRPGERPSGTFDEASTLIAADKSEFGTSRIRRWFGRDWAPLG
jgi:sulfide:quinone oxidoreductase